MEFFASTNQGVRIKVLVDILYNNLTTGYFSITEEGIFLTCCNEKETVLIVLALNREKFDDFHFTKERKFGVNLSGLQTLLKTIKRKDGVDFSILEENSNELQITMISASKNGTSTKKEINSIKLQEYFPQNVVVPSDHLPPKVIPSGDFQRMCKKFDSLDCSTISVEIVGSDYASFSGEGRNACVSTHVFGTSKESAKSFRYQDAFFRTTLSLISKISGLSDKVRIYAPSESPTLKFESDVGSLGCVSFFIKNKEHILKEENS